MAKGRKTGGRQKGTLNKRTRARRLGVEELLAKYGYDPLEAMIAEASNPATDPEVRRGLHREIAAYAYPKLRATEANVSASVECPAVSEVFKIALERVYGEAQT